MRVADIRGAGAGTPRTAGVKRAWVGVLGRCSGQNLALDGARQGGAGFGSALETPV